MNNITAVIMAAGEGTRMRSDKCKVMHELCGYPIIEYVVRAVEKVSSNLPIVIVGNNEQEVRKYLGNRAVYTKQEKRLGTGHAVMIASDYLKETGSYSIVLAGDIPFIAGETLQSMLEYCIQEDFGSVALTAVVDNPREYGRIVRNTAGDFLRIVEHKEASPEETKIKEINASVYCFKNQALLEGLGKIDNLNAKGEYYLTDVLERIALSGEGVGLFTTENPDEIMGINNRIELSAAMKLLYRRINSFHMENGVTIIDPDNTYIGIDAVIGKDTVIYPGNILEGKVIIGEKCTLFPNNRIISSSIGRSCAIQTSLITESVIESETTIGPCAHIRPGSLIGNHVRIGNFVEIKNSTVGDGSKVSHLSYVGDGVVGSDVNIGCGVVFVNYDGEKKSKTIVGDRAFVGCNVNLVAPVSVDSDVYIAAGSTITNDIPSGSLAIARERQVNKLGWVAKRKTKSEGAEK